MAVEITIPSPGESITEVALGPWQKSSGDWVEKDETLVEIESDKVNLEIPAPESGVLNITEEEGAELSVGDVIGTIDPDGDKPAGKSGGQKKSKAAGKDDAGEDGAESGKAGTATAEKSRGGDDGEQRDDDGEDDGEAAGSDARATSLARKVAAERGIDLSDVKGTGPAGRIRKADVLKADDAKSAASENGSVDAPSGKSEKTDESDRSAPPAAAPLPGGARAVRREKMSKLRQRIAQRLVEAQHNAAMLTTFNEADMSEVIALRKQYKEDFQKKHEIGLGFMGFFVKACVSALQAFPRVNAYIVENEIEFHDYVDISIAVGTDKGLVVPVVRNAEQLSFAQIELAIKQLADRARAGKLTIDEMTGGTFTITNGGIFGSLNSTPILNPPQSGILGMHAIKNRPVEDPSNAGQVVVRPMMYLAVSYDHRIIDGAEAVQFLVHIKNMIESPERLLLDV